MCSVTWLFSFAEIEVSKEVRQMSGARTIYRRVERGQLHFVETDAVGHLPDGGLLRHALSIFRRELSGISATHGRRLVIGCCGM